MCSKNKQEEEDMNTIPCAQAVSSLIYAMTSTRLDICYAVRLVNWFQSNLGKEHWKVVKRIFRYLRGTKNNEIMF